ncbi:MAG: IS66 family transposase [Myxococcales bacterium]|nr:IS66 family transposase [Myxococcales bacterium]
MLVRDSDRPADLRESDRKPLARDRWVLIRVRVVREGCDHCDALRAELEHERARNAELSAENARLHSELAEALKLAELQQQDLERYRKAYEEVRPNHPERVPASQLQLGFLQVLEMFGGGATPVNDVAEATDSEDDASAAPRGKKRKKGRHAHGRRNMLDLHGLETKEIEIIPPEVRAADGKGFKRIGEEVSSRVAHRAASYLHLLIRRVKFVRIEDEDAATGVPERATISCPEALESSPVLIAPLPDSLWPNVMADPSAIAHVIISKYDDILPLHRQERISARDGFVLPRSTQCGWLSRAHAAVYRIVDAMFEDAKAHAFCMATDATGAPVRAAGECESWDVFVFLADRDHVVFRYVEGHATSDKFKKLLEGFHGHLLADAAPIYDALYETGDVIEHCCWFHCRRYFYRALETDKALALGPLSLIAKLFEVDGECAEISDLGERTATRALRAKPLLELLDQWVDRHREHVDPRGPLKAAIGYYDNQHDALHRFVDDARIGLHNNYSEQQLRNLALGRHNWTFFANETGLRWYTVFRSLIASCRLHGLNAETYLEEILRLAPHWPAHRVLELAPKYWAATRDKLDDEQRAILARPWECEAAPEQTSSDSPEISLAS